MEDGGGRGGGHTQPPARSADTARPRGPSRGSTRPAGGQPPSAEILVPSSDVTDPPPVNPASDSNARTQCGDLQLGAGLETGTGEMRE